MGGTGLEPEGPPGQEGGEGAVKASQLNPICLLMKAVLHGMCESWGPGKRQVGFPFTYGSQRASRHEGVGVCWFLGRLKSEIDGRDQALLVTCVCTSVVVLSLLNEF